MEQKKVAYLELGTNAAVILLALAEYDRPVAGGTGTA